MDQSTIKGVGSSVRSAWLLLLSLQLAEAQLTASSARNGPPELAGLKSVWVLVSDNIPGLESAELKSAVEAHLRKAGLQTEPARGARTLFVRITYDDVHDCPGTLYLRVSVSLSERVRLERNPKLADVRATTWETTELAAVSSAEASDEAKARALSLVDSFADTVAYATSVYAKPTASRP